MDDVVDRRAGTSQHDAAGVLGRGRRDQLIERAILMFNEHGYERVRITDLTDSLGMSKSNFYRYFHSKKEVLLACFSHSIDRMQELESQLPEGDFFARLHARALAAHERDWLLALPRVLQWGIVSPETEIRTKAKQAYQAMVDTVRRDLDEVMETGRALKLDSELAAYAFSGLQENVWFRTSLDDRYSPDEATQFIIDAASRLLFNVAVPKESQGSCPEDFARLICRDGTSFSLCNVRHDEGTGLPANLGCGRIDVDLARVAGMAVKEAGENCIVSVHNLDGTQLDLCVDGSLEISGEIPGIGRFRIAVRDVSSLTRD